ncbi:hypothetical protein CO670_26840 [Rhizobium sp. J15]|uniref:M48 family metalloprotease n=1 Tax=Rhizobium sp. J15 TaxID=2035450 RepID=UPI000BEA778E|nr:M48 family metalloprotease [Rhizobium sp. J15]PDT13753.1 hypothetical protein CO670_26840 [Rhizobium sp. J15]
MKATCCLMPILGVLTWGQAFAQNSRADGLACVRSYFQISVESTDIYDPEVAFEPNEATQLITDIAERANFDIKLRAITCDQIDNAVPFQPNASDQLPEQLKSQTFIIYRRSWMRTILGQKREKAIFILGHELGHIIKKHQTERVSLQRLQKEKEADREGGCAVARLGGDWTTLADVIAQTRDEVAGDYPSRSESTNLAREGFLECGGRLSEDNFPSTEVVYWYKRADNGRVVEALNGLGLNVDVRQTGIYEGVDFSDYNTSTVTCHAGAPISLVRQVALALYDNGIEIRGISKPDFKNRRIRNRITVEATSWNHARLTRRAIQDLSYCPSQYDPTYGAHR